MPKKIKTLLIILVTVQFLNCWQKQDHDITRPLIPNYVFNGTAVDIDSRENLHDISIKMVEEYMLYDVDFATRIVKTDSNGFFQFDSVYPGNYTFSFERDGFYINEKRITIGHKDTSALLEVPKIFIGGQFSRGGSAYPALAITGSEAWKITRAKDLLHPPWPDIQRDWFTISKYINYHWEITDWLRSPLNKKVIKSMAFGRDGVYACVPPDTLFVLNRWDGSLSGNYVLPVTVNGIAFYPSEKCIYTCSKNSIYKHEPDLPEKIENTYEINTPDLSAIAYYRNIYSYDNSSFLLRKHDTDMSILETFALINEQTETQINKIWDMSFDGYGNLWVSIP
ncbi:carboxypeptidase regulatory-like domain-containing protein [candidate division KSB1 bacterium]|nr:carboxypeptidase regulatory-like domain-containing protein [candidate division KSB1 bacterium]